MAGPLLEFIVDESKWLPVAMSLAFVVTALRLCRFRRPDLSASRRILPAMNLFFGVTLTTMAVGHLSAVTTKLALGNLAGSAAWLYTIGAILLIPSCWLVGDSWRRLAAGDDRGRPALVLNAWLAVSLMALGIYNLPLTVPPVLSVCYQLHSRRAVGWVIVGLLVVVHLGLFIGSLIFMASGQSFEEFRASW